MGPVAGRPGVRMLGAMVWSGILLVMGAPAPSPGGTDAGWQWPLRPPPPVLRRFDPPAHPWEAGHRGVDLAAPAGRPVFAAGAGRVAFAHDLAGRGVVTITHGALRTTYLPVRPTVRPGQIVAAGARIGVVEGVLGHCGQESCLHWGLLRGGSYLDPFSLLGLGPVRLLPWWHSPLPATVPGPAPPPQPGTGVPGGDTEADQAGTGAGRGDRLPPAAIRSAPASATRSSAPPPVTRPPLATPATRPVGATVGVGTAIVPIIFATVAVIAMSRPRLRLRGRRSRGSRSSSPPRRPLPGIPSRSAPDRDSPEPSIRPSRSSRSPSPPGRDP